MKPMELAIQACDMMMRRFPAAQLPPVGHFYYHQGVFLSGVYQTYRLTGEAKYLAYIKDWMDSVLDENGDIINYVHGNLDDIMPGILLFRLLDETGDARYAHALETVHREVCDVRRTDEGGFSHKVTLPGQMWLDGVYMACPFCAEYARYRGDEALRGEVIREILLMKKHHLDKTTGLLYHAWDQAASAEWANPATGCSSEFWGRAIGWLPVGALNALDFIPRETPCRDEAEAFVAQLLKDVCCYQSEEGRWYQVVNKGGEEGNWLENSCSCLFSAALAKAVRLGLLEGAYAENARRSFAGVAASLTWEDGEIQIGQVCVGTNVGDYRHYIARPVHANDLHGVGAFLLMCAELENLSRAQGGN